MLSSLNNPWILVPLVFWTFFWKGIALWKSARRGESAWFVALLILNTLGILEIIYIIITARKEKEPIMDQSQAEELTKKIII